ncbi:MAG: RNA 2',3'-cyclic phosphodiesterase, partial [Polyangiaceae bacterium]
ENLHISTKFIGEWPEARIDEIHQALKGVAKTGAIRIAVRGVGWFPDAKRARVFWASVSAGEPLAKLARSTEQAVAAIGVEGEQRAYSPHLTLARVNVGAPVDALAKAAGEPDFGAFQATSFFLYLSENGKYCKLAEFSLTS